MSTPIEHTASVEHAPTGGFIAVCTCGVRTRGRDAATALDYMSAHLAQHTGETFTRANVARSTTGHGFELGAL